MLGMDTDNTDSERPNRIAQELKNLAEFLKNEQRYHLDKAQEYGYSSEAFEKTLSTCREGAG
jgi:hypothetical protein